MSQVKFVAASVLGVVCEGVLYGAYPGRIFVLRARRLILYGRKGIYIPLLLTAFYVQWQKRVKRDRVNKIMAFTTVFYGLTITLVCNIHRSLPRMLLINTGQHWLFTFIRGLRGVLFLPPGEDMENFFQTISNPLSVCKVVLLQVEILVGVWIMVSTCTLARESG